MKIEILYADDDMVIANKPAGMLVIPDRFDETLTSLKRQLETQLQIQLWVVHRLDRDTSGIICFAKNEAAHKFLSMLFQEREVAKYYIGLVNGRLMPTEGRIEKPIAEHPAVKGKMIVAKKGKPSITDYTLLKQWPLHCLVQFQIHTGRTHQIRVHLQSIGHSLVCDELYGDGKPFLLSGIKRKFRLSDKEEMERPLLSRMALHAMRLVLTTPSGKEITVEAPLPKDIAACIKQLDKWTPAHTDQ